MCALKHYPRAKVAFFPETFDVISMSFASRKDFLVLPLLFLCLFRTFVARKHQYGQHAAGLSGFV